MCWKRRRVPQGVCWLGSIGAFHRSRRGRKKYFTRRQSPLSIVYRVNAGRIPRDHWTQDPNEGGRIIGEVCHFIDLMQFLTGAAPKSVYAECRPGRST